MHAVLLPHICVRQKREDDSPLRDLNSHSGVHEDSVSSGTYRHVDWQIVTAFRSSLLPKLQLLIVQVTLLGPLHIMAATPPKRRKTFTNTHCVIPKYFHLHQTQFRLVLPQRNSNNAHSWIRIRLFFFCLSA